VTAERWIWRGLVATTVLALLWGVLSMDWSHVWPSSGFLLEALGRSWLLAFLALTFGAVAAIPLATLRAYGPARLAAVVTALIEAVRMTPDLMIIFWVYFALPLATRSNVTAWSAALWALSVIAAVYLAEIIRGGLLSVPAGQREGAAALGLSRLQGFVLVQLPQAARNMLPALIAQFVSLFKATSLVYAIGVMEFFRAVTVTNNAVYAPYPLYTLLAAGYFVSCWAITRAIRYFDPAYELSE
jgi:polar amino acid transport system permease protein